MMTVIVNKRTVYVP